MALDELEALVGKWAMGAAFPGAPSIDEQLESGVASATFEWMDGREFVVQRWTVPDPGPDGLAVIGPDPDNEGGYLQHYFDNRGVARVYKMTFEGREWKLSREEADISPLDFSQRYTGTLSEDGGRIDGTWEINEDGSWAKDFDLSYTKVG